MACERVKEVYVDGIGRINFIGGMLKFDLYAFEPNDAEDEKDAKPVPYTVERLVMSPNGFLASYDAMVNMINKLQDAGVISKKEDMPKPVETTPVVEGPSESNN